VGAATFQRLFLFSRGLMLDWTAEQLANFDLEGVDNSCWHIPDLPSWLPLRDIPSQNYSQHVPPLSPLHAWLGFARNHWQHRECVLRLFEALLRTCGDPAVVLNRADEGGRTPLIYSLQTEGHRPIDNPTMVPFRLLMAHQAVNPTLIMQPGSKSALNTALLYGHHADVILQLLGAHATALEGLRRTPSSFITILSYPALACAFLPDVAAREPGLLFASRYIGRNDFAGELAHTPDAMLWRAITTRVPSTYLLPIRPDAPLLGSDDWHMRDGLRAAISRGSPDRALWMLEHTRDHDLNAYDVGGKTVLMRAILGGAILGGAMDKLIVALLKRQPALDINTRALDFPPGPDKPLPPDALAQSDIVAGKTARELFLASWTHMGQSFVMVSVALEAAHARETKRIMHVVHVMSICSRIPSVIIALIAAYAGVQSVSTSTTKSQQNPFLV
jgi:hypothetical protein